MWRLNQLGRSSFKISNNIGVLCTGIVPFSQAVKFVKTRRKSSSFRATTICMSINMEDKARSTELLIVSDLDFTMVDHDDSSHESLLNFNSLWAAEYAHNSALVYSTGRSPERYCELRRHVPLLTPSIVVLSIGTEIFYGNPESQQADPTWINLMDQGWNRDIVVEETNKFPQLQPQDESDQRPYKVSFYLDKKEAPKVMEKLSARLQQRQLDVKLIFSGGNAFDVLPKRGGKGEALAYVLKKIESEGWLPKNVLVCGDSGNDTELFTVEGVNGVIVSNAQEELIQWYNSGNFVNNIYLAGQRCSAGIIQALQHFEFGPHISPREKIKDNEYHQTESELKAERLLEDGSAKREVIEFNVFLEMWLNGQVENSTTYQRVIDVIANGATMIYPWGKESSLKEAMELVRQKHGLMRENKFMTWIDKIEEKKLSEGVYLVTWESWETVPGGEHKGYYATAILISKEKTPNGLGWIRVHETNMNCGSQ